jgi:23S rRNA pseudouridine2605 synthase
MKTINKIRNVSLARALSKLGFASRSQAKKIILDGNVTVNRVTILDPDYRCSLDSDQIAVNGKSLSKKPFTYIIMNKPIGVITTRSDEKNRPTIYDILGDVGKWVFPVGRLDKDTSGLLLITNDNQLGERLTNPDTKIPKIYNVKINKPIQDNHIKIIKNGMSIGDQKLLYALVNVINKNEIELTIFEGKNRQIRRMFEALGYEVNALSRLKIGNLELKDLKIGEWRYLTKSEIQLLRSNKIPNS